MSHHVYTIERAARELGISPNHLFNLCLTGGGPVARRIAAKDRAIILTEDFVAWLKTCPTIQPVNTVEGGL